MTLPSFERARRIDTPYPHMRVPHILAAEQADRALEWLASEAPWTLRVENFYQQHEFSLLTTRLDAALEKLVSDQCIAHVSRNLELHFEIGRELRLVDVNAHRLTSRQVIRVHNDYIEGAETHRLLIQLNHGWTSERGGLLMLFAGDDVATVTNIVMPTHASGFAFEISPKSFHAVSEVKSGERYTIVYTFA